MEAFLNLLIYDIFVNEFAGMTPLIFLEKREGLLFYRLDPKNLPELLVHIRRFFKTFVDFDFSFSEHHGLRELLRQRDAGIRQWYLEENGAFLQQLLDSFQDSLSQVSFLSYLKQRFLAKLHGDHDIVYPVKPPRETLGWRQARLARAVPLPVIEGVSEHERAFYHETTFLLEQYAIEDAVGVRKGDIVIDAGGFVGDTALYFAGKCGDAGKVYSFEPIPRIVETARRNIALNGLEARVEVVPFALSDTCGKFSFMDLASGSRVTDAAPARESAAANAVEVESVTLDSFMERNKIPRVDFVKSDLEGWDMAFLRGAAHTIKACRPACGLTLYHKHRDILEIPQFLQSMDAGYKFWFRSETEPVLFAKV